MNAERGRRSAGRTAPAHRICAVPEGNTIAMIQAAATGDIGATMTTMFRAMPQPGATIALAGDRRTPEKITAA
ncbi:hypothetical protein [Mycobacterium colombiense]|uniref:hypothetical protein n=1 Tax=Mycobacterium colombiense TaxID=339268 RepID=UPI0010576913|nr:hypothetical protein [Mycobacterium colombiense]